MPFRSSERFRSARARSESAICRFLFPDLRQQDGYERRIHLQKCNVTGFDDDVYGGALLGLIEIRNGHPIAGRRPIA
ncbi:hypothetical protein ZHAS_00011423 [Anopheles sinensis]|uniref:Uncharacterized protein n=1 Tax=Anopheles sinensis TaxID=74873 RepID=A0A084W0E9_ANOSI|nr:hypothetical protein ZHAS_00011423 [Anopheles sinensis]